MADWSEQAKELGLVHQPTKGQWVVFYAGRTRYVAGRVEAHAAVAAYHRKQPGWDAESDDTRPLPVNATRRDPTVLHLVNAFLASKLARVGVEDGIDRRTYDEYKEALEDFATVVGHNTLFSRLTPIHFRHARQYWEGTLEGYECKTLGLARRKKFIINVRSMFKFAGPMGNQFVDRLPLYGTEFRIPSKKAFRIAEARREEQYGELMFGVEELAQLWAKTFSGRREAESAEVGHRARILMALNFCFGNDDVAEFPKVLADRLVANHGKSDILDHVRAKNGVRRKCPAWPETVQAIREYLAVRRSVEDPAHAGLLFVTRYGQPFITYGQSSAGKPMHKDRVAGEFDKLMAKAGVRRPGRNFRSLRRTSRTCADDLKDQRAAALIAGHETNDVAALYVERVDPARLYAITNHMRQALLLPMLARAREILAATPKYQYPKHRKNRTASAEPADIPAA